MATRRSAGVSSLARGARGRTALARARGRSPWGLGRGPDAQAVFTGATWHGPGAGGGHGHKSAEITGWAGVPGSVSDGGRPARFAG